MKRLLVLLAIISCLVMAGCGGGSGSGSSSNVSRVIAGFVYVGGAGNATPAVAVLPTANPPAGFFAPTSGTITVTMPNGTVSRGSAGNSLNFDMSVSNAVVCTVSGPASTNLSVSGTGLNYNGSARALSTFTAGVGTSANNGTVLLLNTGGTTYTPGPAASVQATINGVAPTNPLQHFIAGDPVKSLAVVALDASGIVTPATFTVTDSGAAAASVVIAGSGNSFTLTAGNMSATVGTLAFTLTPSTGNALGGFNADFALGAPTSVTLTSVSANVLWGTVTVPVANTTTGVTATVFNVNGLPLPGAAVTFNNAKAPGNTWSASPGTNFTAISNGGVSDASGVVTATFNPPDAIDPVLNAGQKAAKGVSAITATAGSATSLADNITVNRPVGSIVIAGPSRIDVGTSTPIAAVPLSPQSYAITGTVDVDNDPIATPAGAQNWALVNVDRSAITVGNTGDSVTSSNSNASINGSGVVTAGGSAGQVTVTVQIGTTTSNTITTEVFGIPSRIVLNPDTVASVIPSARGEYAFGTVGATQNFSFALVDSAGHSAGPGEISTVTTTSSIQALTGGSITPGGVGVTSFTLTCGNADGLFTLGASGTWTGAKGGSGPINLTKNVGQNAP